MLASAASLIAELGGGEVATTAIDRIAQPYEPADDRAAGRRVPRSSSARPSRKTSASRFSAPSDAESVDESKTSITAEAPSWRPDLQREVDPHRGGRARTRLRRDPHGGPSCPPSEAGTPGLLKTVDALRAASVTAGLYEAINYGFVLDRRASQSPRVDECRRPSRTRCPKSERSCVRPCFPGLTGAAARAQRHGAVEVRLFEIARTFDPSDDMLPRETSTLAIALAGHRNGWIGGAEPFDLYDGKGVIEAILDGSSAASRRSPLAICPPSCTPSARRRSPSKGDRWGSSARSIQTWATSWASSAVSSTR